MKRYSILLSSLSLLTALQVYAADEDMQPLDAAEPEWVALDTRLPLATANIEPPQVVTPTPLSRAELQHMFKAMQIRMGQEIEAWGARLTADDFERSWTGRQLKKAKRQEVCGIYQTVINDSYQYTLAHQTGLSAKDQALLKDRNAFIQNLGFKDNIVDTQMGFNCRLR